MPIYEYRCQTCQHEMEVMQKITEEALTKCPECGKDTLTKLISRSSFQLKGKGWYATDFKNSSKTPASESKSPSTSDSQPEKKSENKSESKSETGTPAAVTAAKTTTSSSSGDT